MKVSFLVLAAVVLAGCSCEPARSHGRDDAAVAMDDAAVPMDDAFVSGCAPGTHGCSGACVANDDVAHCGSSCDACPLAPAHGHATCDGLSCGIACDSGFTLCGSACVDLARDRENCGACGNVCAANRWCDGTVACHASPIEHVVVIVQENHTFDSYFGRYCTAAPGSEPSCTSGPSCCEAAPASVSGVVPLELTDSDNYNHDRNHDYECELCELDYAPAGLPPPQDHFVDNACPQPIGCSEAGVTYCCSEPGTWRIALEADVPTYYRYARTGALADRYFQPLAGGTASNDVYLAGASFRFFDNQFVPGGNVGHACALATTPPTLPDVAGRNIGDVVMAGGHSFRIYADGYNDAVAAAPSCPGVFTYPTDCTETTLFVSACHYDSSDIPFNYWASTRDTYTRDYEAHFLADVASGSLADFVYVKFRTHRNEHPGFGTLSLGQHWVDQVVSAILSSPTYANNTLVLITWDEGGGFYDHVGYPGPTFPEAWTSGTGPAGESLAGYAVPYGTRVPFIALGHFARPNAISHVVMEHSSIVRFLEWNFVGPSAVGTVGVRDGQVNNIGSMLIDPLVPGQVGYRVPLARE